MLTWVTCIGFVGVDMVGLRGVPSTLFTKLVNPLFFLSTSGRTGLPTLASSEYRCFGLLVPLSERGGEIVSIFRPKTAKLADWRSDGLAGRASVVYECWGGEGRCGRGEGCSRAEGAFW